MDATYLNNILDILRKMSELENAIGELYAECAKRLPDEADFWMRLSNEECKHAEYIKHSLDIVAQNVKHFSQLKQFSVVALNNVIKYVKELQTKVAKGVIAKKEILTSARDLEQSILEAKGWEFLKTDLIEYVTLMKGIAEDTVQHRTQLSEKIHLVL